MRTLYIVGNGFDMAHGLDTRYWKFREYLEDKYPDFLYQFENLYNIQAIDDSDPRIKPEDIERWKKSVDNALWSTFEDKIRLTAVTHIITPFNLTPRHSFASISSNSGLSRSTT